MKKYLSALMGLSLFFLKAGDGVLCQNPVLESTSENSSEATLTKSLQNSGFTSDEINEVLQEVNFQTLNPQEISWVTATLPQAMGALKKIKLPITEGKLGRALVLQELGEKITPENLATSKTIFIQLNDLNQKDPESYAYWDDVTYHLMAALLAVKGQPEAKIVSVLSEVSQAKLTPEETSGVLETLKSAAKIPSNLSAIIKKAKEEKAAPAKSSLSGTNHQSASQGFKKLMGGKSSLSKKSENNDSKEHEKAVAPREKHG